MRAHMLFNPCSNPPSIPDFLNKKNFARAYRFHTKLPGYVQTPLYELEKTALQLGIDKLWVKDESKRFGLESFKALGASWAIEQILASSQAKPHIFATATDGNHGRSVAWVAAMLGYKAVIHMPKGSSHARVREIRNLGAECIVTQKNYDQTVLDLYELATEKGWHIIQDTAWPGYEEIPSLIMQGYGTIILESMIQISKNKYLFPTHVILQAGVGSFSAAIIAAISKFFPLFPKIIIVEPFNANCIYQSLSSQAPVTVQGNLETIMAGLACGKPSSLALPILQQAAACAIACDDEMAKEGMHLLAKNPDVRIISGESGAVTAGALKWLLQCPEKTREKINLDANSRVLLINTEGATDPCSWQEITGCVL